MRALKSNEKICPLLSTATQTPCWRERCVWFNVDEGMCDVQVIGMCADRILKQILWTRLVEKAATFLEIEKTERLLGRGRL